MTRAGHVRQRHAERWTPVAHGVIPAWLRERLHVALGVSPQTTADIAIGALRRQLGPCTWLEFWGATYIDGVEVFVAEPNEVDEVDALELEELGRLAGIQWDVSSLVYLEPGSRVRVTIRPSGEPPRTDVYAGELLAAGVAQ